MPQTDEQVLNQTEAIWRFLDTMSAQNPKQYEQFVGNILKDGEKNNMGPPVPEFVVETQKVCLSFYLHDVAKKLSKLQLF